jgi:hypothetical protein
MISIVVFLNKTRIHEFWQADMVSYWLKHRLLVDSKVGETKLRA